MNANTRRIEISDTLPQNELAEKSLIENLIFRPENVDLAVSIVIADDFYSILRANVYQRILKFHEAGRVWNGVTLEDSFRSDPNFIKYRDFFDELRPFTGDLVGHNAKIIKECADERKLIEATYKANTDLFNAVGVAAVKAALEQALKEVA